MDLDPVIRLDDTHGPLDLGPVIHDLDEVTADLRGMADGVQGRPGHWTGDQDSARAYIAAYERGRALRTAMLGGDDGDSRP